MKVERYGVCKKGESDPIHMTDDYEEAYRIAMLQKAQLICYTFEFSDSELLHDFSENGGGDA